MAQFFFCLRTPERVVRHALPQEHPDLRSALVAAQQAARRALRREFRGAPRSLAGSFDVENAQQEPIARIMLADLASQLR